MRHARQNLILSFFLALVVGCSPSKHVSSADSGMPTDAGALSDGGALTDGGAPDDGGNPIGNVVTVHARDFRYPVEQIETNAWVAYQDGDGVWQRAPGVAGDYSFSVTDSQGRYAIATRCPNTHNVNIALETLAERNSWTVNCVKTDLPATIEVDMVSSNWPASSFQAHLAVGGSSPVTDPNQGNTDKVFVLPGVQDAFGYITGSDGSRWISGYLQHGIDVQALTSVAFAFGFAPVEVPLTIGALSGGGTLQGQSLFLSANGTTVSLPLHVAGSTTFDAVPSSALNPKDFTLLGESFFNSATSTSTGAVAVFNAPPASLSLVTPEQLIHQAVSVENVSGEVIPGLTWEGGPSSHFMAHLFIVQGTRLWTMRASVSRLGGNTSLSVPDLAAAPGYDPQSSLDPTAGFGVDLTVISADHGTAEAYLDLNYDDSHSRHFTVAQTLTYGTTSLFWTP